MKWINGMLLGHAEVFILLTESNMHINYHNTEGFLCLSGCGCVGCVRWCGQHVQHTHAGGPSKTSRWQQLSIGCGSEHRQHPCWQTCDPTSVLEWAASANIIITNTSLKDHSIRAWRDWELTMKRTNVNVTETRIKHWNWAVIRCCFLTQIALTELIGYNRHKSH